MATIQLGVINDIGIIRIAPFTAVELKCLASAVNADNSAALADAATESANAAAATALSYVGISPTGAYTNLAALQAAYQTGEDGVFVVKDTGHWYFWNGSAWEDGGEYQKDIPTTTIEELRRSDLQQMSAIKEVENTLNAININQETTNTASGYGTISLPKNAANGGMSVKLEGLTAENLIENGDFRNGTTGWTAEHGNLSYTNRVLSVTGSGTNAAIRFRSQIGVKSSNKYYFKMRVRPLSSLATRFTTMIRSAGGIATISNIVIINIPVQNQWYDYSGILTATATDTGGVIYITYEHSSAVDANGAVMELDCDYGVKAFNLTATFGADNEPTVEECDAMFADYFEGVKSFEPTGRVRSVGKNLFDGELIEGNVNGSNGEVDYYEGRTASVNMTPVKTGSTIHLQYDLGGDISGYFGWYNKKREFMYRTSIISVGTSVGTPITVPDNANYVRFSLIAQIPTNFTAIWITYGSTATTYEPYHETSLYLTAPELRSNGTVKDEIRKGANGYELVRRVGNTDLAEATETLNFAGLDFSDGEKWVNTANTTSSTVSGFTTSSIGGMTSTQWKVKYVKKGFYSLFIIKGTSSVSWGLYGGGSSPLYRSFGAGNFDAVIFGTPTTYETIYIRLSGAGDINFTDFNIKTLALSSDLVLDGSFFTKLNDGTILYTLATPVITPISYGGILNSAENGTVYHEPIIADAGVYGTSLSILMTDYPIDSLEEIIKYEDGAETRLDTSTAVIASDGLSFTHPDLADGDLVLFTYAFDKESTSGNITATFYDSNVVKIDTATGTAYKIEDVVTNGILTRKLTEVQL